MTALPSRLEQICDCQVLPFSHDHMDGVSRLFSNQSTDVLSHPQNMARSSHSDNASFVGCPVKIHMHLYSSLAELFLHIKRTIYIGSVNIGYFLNYSIKFINLSFIFFTSSSHSRLGSLLVSVLLKYILFFILHFIPFHENENRFS